MSMAFVRFGAGLRVTLVMLFLGGLMLVSGFGFLCASGPLCNLHWQFSRRHLHATFLHSEITR
jgi:hypothetical protein